MADPPPNPSAEDQPSASQLSDSIDYAGSEDGGARALTRGMRGGGREGVAEDAEQVGSGRSKTSSRGGGSKTSSRAGDGAASKTSSRGGGSKTSSRAGSEKEKDQKTSSSRGEGGSKASSRGEGESKTSNSPGSDADKTSSPGDDPTAEFRAAAEEEERAEEIIEKVEEVEAIESEQKPRGFANTVRGSLSFMRRRGGSADAERRAEENRLKAEAARRAEAARLAQAKVVREQQRELRHLLNEESPESGSGQESEEKRSASGTRGKLAAADDGEESPEADQGDDQDQDDEKKQKALLQVQQEEVAKKQEEQQREADALIAGAVELERQQQQAQAEEQSPPVEEVMTSPDIDPVQDLAGDVAIPISPPLEEEHEEDGEFASPDLVEGVTQGPQAGHDEAQQQRDLRSEGEAPPPPAVFDDEVAAEEGQVELSSSSSKRVTQATRVSANSILKRQLGAVKAASRMTGVLRGSKQAAMSVEALSLTSIPGGQDEDEQDADPTKASAGGVDGLGVGPDGVDAQNGLATDVAGMLLDSTQQDGHEDNANNDNIDAQPTDPLLGDHGDGDPDSRSSKQRKNKSRGSKKNHHHLHDEPEERASHRAAREEEERIIEELDEEFRDRVNSEYRHGSKAGEIFMVDRPCRDDNEIIGVCGCDKTQNSHPVLTCFCAPCIMCNYEGCSPKVATMWALCIILGGFFFSAFGIYTTLFWQVPLLGVTYNRARHESLLGFPIPADGRRSSSGSISTVDRESKSGSRRSRNTDMAVGSRRTDSEPERMSLFQRASGLLGRLSSLSFGSKKSEKVDKDKDTTTGLASVAEEQGNVENAEVGGASKKNVEGEGEQNGEELEAGADAVVVDIDAVGADGQAVGARGVVAEGEAGDIELEQGQDEQADDMNIGDDNTTLGLHLDSPTADPDDYSAGLPRGASGTFSLGAGIAGATNSTSATATAQKASAQNTFAGNVFRASTVNRMARSTADRLRKKSAKRTSEESADGLLDVEGGVDPDGVGDDPDAARRTISEERRRQRSVFGERSIFGDLFANNDNNQEDGAENNDNEQSTPSRPSRGSVSSSASATLGGVSHMDQQRNRSFGGVQHKSQSFMKRLGNGAS
ncbi:unnamed protein product [Amoebophrya sp. A25]|nr:unnamed protein product [Amoebophrya sp. A25]|eukprot:GSA25T00003573001.1